MASNFEMWRKAGQRGAYRRNPDGAETTGVDEKEQNRFRFMRWLQETQGKYLGGQDDGVEEYPEYGPQM